MPDHNAVPPPSETYHFPWIVYLSAPLADGLTPPKELVCERTLGGGLILSAALERLDPDGPEHLRRTRLLQTIIAERAEPYTLTHKLSTGYPPARVGPF